MKQVVSPEADTGASTLTNTTRPGVVMGTLLYMSPEQVRGEAVEALSDIFSFVCVLYEMVTERQPFSRATTAETIAAILKEEPPALERTDKLFSARLEQVILHCLEKGAEKRYQTAREVTADLRSILSGTSEPAAVPASRRLRLWASVGAVVVMILLGLAYWLYLASAREKFVDSLAVVPFVNVDGDPDMKYLSDGISESISNNLAKLPRLKVMARGSVSLDTEWQNVEQAAAAGRKLGVQAVVTGRVVQQDDRLVVNARLVDVSENRLLWGEQYSRKLSDIFAVQEDIAREISMKLRQRLTREEQQRLTKRYTANTDAYRHYIKGRYYSSQHNTEGWKKGIEQMNQAIALDPAYALAYAGLAASYYEASSLLLPPNEANTQGQRVSPPGVEAGRNAGRRPYRACPGQSAIRMGLGRG